MAFNGVAEDDGLAPGVKSYERLVQTREASSWPEVLRDWRATMEKAEIVPSDTLQGVILTQVDRLEPEVKETLQVASVVGDSFALPVLETVTKSPPNLSTCVRISRWFLPLKTSIGQTHHRWHYWNT